jgi:hypothetical protein
MLTRYTMPSRKLMFAAALAALTAGWLAGWRRARARRRQQRPLAQPHALQTWEGEGGGVPVAEHRTAAQVSPGTPGTGNDAGNNSNGSSNNGGADTSVPAHPSRFSSAIDA